MCSWDRAQLSCTIWVYDGPLRISSLAPISSSGPPALRHPYINPHVGHSNTRGTPGCIGTSNLFSLSLPPPASLSLCLLLALSLSLSHSLSRSLLLACSLARTLSRSLALALLSRSVGARARANALSLTYTANCAYETRGRSPVRTVRRVGGR